MQRIELRNVALFADRLDFLILGFPVTISLQAPFSCFTAASIPIVHVADFSDVEHCKGKQTLNFIFLDSLSAVKSEITG